MSTHSLSSPAGEPYFSLESLRLADPVAVKARDDEVPPLIDMDGANVFAMAMTLVFLPQLQTVGVLFYIMGVLFYVLRHRGTISEILHNQSFFLLFPALAILSVVWSDAPADTLKHSIEFFVTVIGGLMLAQVRNRRALMFALFATFAIYTAGSLIFGRTVAVGDTGAKALSGLTTSKNLQASTEMVGALISLAWFFLGFKTRRYLQSALALMVFVVETYLAVLAKSDGAMAAMALGVSGFLLLVLLIKGGRRLRVAIVGFGGISALTLLMTFLVFTGPIVDQLSSWFGKDLTLTGRTYLWTRARDMIVEQPILGHGFAAFWQQGNLDAEGLWQFAHIQSRMGFNFHNTSYDILVSLGWAGMALFALTLVVGLVKIAAAYVKHPSLLSAFWLALAASMLVRMPIETMGIYEFDMGTVLIFAIFGYGAKAAQLNEAWRALPARAMAGFGGLGINRPRNQLT